MRVTVTVPISFLRHRRPCEYSGGFSEWERDEPATCLQLLLRDEVLSVPGARGVCVCEFTHSLKFIGDREPGAHGALAGLDMPRAAGVSSSRGQAMLAPSSGGRTPSAHASSWCRSSPTSFFFFKFFCFLWVTLEFEARVWCGVPRARGCEAPSGEMACSMGFLWAGVALLLLVARC